VDLDLGFPVITSVFFQGCDYYCYGRWDMNGKKVQLL
jgi:hypothetical protein